MCDTIRSHESDLRHPKHVDEKNRENPRCNLRHWATVAVCWQALALSSRHGHRSKYPTLQRRGGEMCAHINIISLDLSLSLTPSLSSCLRKRTLRLLPLPGTPLFPDAPPSAAFLLVDMAALVPAAVGGGLPAGLPAQPAGQGGLCESLDTNLSFSQSCPRRASASA